MIESCPKKRMLLGISFLGILTLVVLVVESHWTDSSQRASRKNNFIVEQNSTCFEKEPFEVIKDCEPCSAFELRSKSIGVCIHTHYKEVLKCANGEIVTRSCDRAAYYDEQTFWKFEGFMLGASLVSLVCVSTRKRVLNKRMVQRVARQLANCV
ncbi:protein JTB [Anthonomus grandis grandis]|uniref:protein JTB n=1 Tax=Anthonomus grandis grandis TaxID=2921223 RepID=UPI002165A3B5|nr:protein JTB [Anthonomus grandis grandis]